MSRKVTTAERRARLGLNHRLAHDSRARSPAEVAESLVALHATDPATVYLSVLTRVRSPDVDEVGEALYERRDLVRMLGMRRTMFVVPRALAAVVQAAATDALAAQMRRRYETLFAQAGVTDHPAHWLLDVGASVVAAVTARGEMTAAQLADVEPRLRTKITMNEDKSYGGTTNVTSMVLMLLSADGHIVRGRPLGSWISSQYRWAAAATWLPGPRATWGPADARVELTRRWLKTFGPATEDDLRWWTGWTLRDVRAALARLPTVKVTLEEGTGLALAEDEAPVDPPAPWVALLPALDPTAMGWTRRDWYLGAHTPALFDRSGNIGPTVWADGRVIGGWAQRRDGSVAVRLLEDAGVEVARAVDVAADSMATTIGGARVTPRFRTPLERELAGG